MNHGGDERDATRQAVAATVEPGAVGRSALADTPPDRGAIAKIDEGPKGDVATPPSVSASNLIAALMLCSLFGGCSGFAGYCLLAAPFRGAREIGVWVALLLVRWIFGAVRDNRRTAAVGPAFRALASGVPDAETAVIAALQRMDPRSEQAALLTHALVAQRLLRGSLEDVESAYRTLRPHLDSSRRFERQQIDSMRMFAAAAVGHHAALEDALAAQRLFVQDSGRVATRIVVEAVQEFVGGDVDAAKARLRDSWNGRSDADLSALLFARAIETYGENSQGGSQAPYRGGPQQLSEHLRVSVREQYAAILHLLQASQGGPTRAHRDPSAPGPSVVARADFEIARRTLRVWVALGALAIATYPHWGVLLGLEALTTWPRVALYCAAAVAMAWAMFASPAPSNGASEAVARPELYALEARWAHGERESTQAGYEAIIASRPHGGDVALAFEKLSRLAETRGEFEHAEQYARRGVRALRDINDDVSVDEGVRVRVILRWAEALSIVGRVDEADFASQGLAPICDPGLVAKWLRFLAAVREDNASAQELARELEPTAYGHGALLVDAVLAEDDPTRAARLRALLAQQPDGRRWLTAMAPRYAALALRDRNEP